VQAQLDFDAEQLQFAAEPADFAVHALSDCDLGLARPDGSISRYC